MLNLEFLIIIYLSLSILIFYFIIDKKEGLACTSKPFYNNGNSNEKTKTPQYNISKTPGFSNDDENSMLSSFITIMDSIDASMNDIKGKIPINFTLGVVNNVDTSPNISVYGSLPNVFLNFSIQNPPPGPPGNPGSDAPLYGPSGEIGPTGPVGETGYWGTTKNTIF